MKTLSTLLLILLLAGCTAQEKKSETTPDSNETKISVTPEVKIVTPTDNNLTTSLFTLNAINGDTIHINETPQGLIFKEFQDKVTFLIFFGHRCPPCLAEIPALKELTQEGHSDLQILGVEVQGLDDEKLKTFGKNMEINYPLVSSTYTNDFINYIAEKAQWEGSIPFLIAFDKKGDVQVVHVGGMAKTDFDNMYNKLSGKQ